MKKAYLDLTKSTCNTILGTYLTSTISTFEDMSQYQKMLGKFLSTLNKCFIEAMYFDKVEYVECLDYIYNTKDAIYSKYFERYK